MEYVKRALGVRLEYDSDTLPILDHYMRAVPADQVATVALVATTAGAYFGEVVRNHIGGRWDISTGDPTTWRFILPSGISFVPARYALAAVIRGAGEDAEEPAEIDAPSLLRQLLDDAVASMAEVSEETFYSLCGRLDTLEHLHEVVAAYAAQEIDRRAAASAEPDEPLEN